MLDFNGARGRNRTTDTAIFSRMLYQLSYPGVSLGRKAVASGRFIGRRARLVQRFGADFSTTRAFSLVFARRPRTGRRCVVFVFFRVGLDHRNRVGPAEPAREIDVGAALRAERTIGF